MDDIQSKAAFTPSNPLYPYRYVALPPSLMLGKDILTFRCIVHGDPIPFKISVRPDADVDDLKRLVKLENAQTLRDFDASNLVLRMLTDPEPVEPENTLARRMELRGDVEMFAKKLTATQKMSTLFPRHPREDHVHILVQLPSTTTKLRRQSEAVIDVVEEDVIAFWHDLWVASKNLIRQETVQRDVDCLEDVDVPATFDVLDGLPVSFTKGGILIRDEYKSAEEGIESHRPYVNAVIIVGHPGIGKSSFLFYLLARRLLARKPTIFQRDAKSIYFFSATGVRRLSRDTVNPSVDSSETWALLDAKQEDKTAPIFLIDRSDIFLVIASLPRPSRWRDVERYRPPVKIWLMEPFALEELIQARQLQQIKRSETSIQQFLQEYGPSARDCYAFCESIPYYFAHHIHDRVKDIAWDTVTDVLTARNNVIGLDDGSHKLILLRPSPTDRSCPSLSIITKTVARLLHERDSDARWQQCFTEHNA